MVEKLKKHSAVIVLIFFICIFYSPFLLYSKVPIPSDTIVGLYSPYRDFYSKDYPNGIPFKNFLITDPVRQTYVWKELAVSLYKKAQIPSWNPYEMTGKPLAGNFQSGAFYPLNIILLFGRFDFFWSLFIISQTLLFSLFTYFYLRSLKISGSSSLLGSTAAAFSGFSISWLEWGNVLHTVLWLPLILLSIDKLVSKGGNRNYIVILSISVISSMLAGHLQFFFYVILTAIAYFILRWFENGKKGMNILKLLGVLSISFLVGSVQLLPALQFISHSARSIDQNFQDISGWFIPWQNLIQFVAPDFFGNPATLNYFGEWNYAEFVGYIGIASLCFVFYSFLKRSSTVVFFGAVSVSSLLFALPTGISSIPYVLNIPLLSSAQPTRLIFLVSFSMIILSSIGFEYFVHSKQKLSFKNVFPVLLVGVIFMALWIISQFGTVLFKDPGEASIAKRNLIFPSIIFSACLAGILLLLNVNKDRVRKAVFILLIFISFFDLLRFSQKFTPFSEASYLYPQTKIINFLQSRDGVFRIASLDRRILAPNFSTHYKLQSIEGYDPLYLKSYAEFIVSLERGNGDLSQPYGFNRIITPHNYNSVLFDFLNVKYVLAYENLPSDKFRFIYEEGATKVYENKSYFERAFFVENIVVPNSMEKLFNVDLHKTAVVDGFYGGSEFSKGEATIISYSENEIIIKTKNNGDGFLVISDAYYPTWKARIDGVAAEIHKTNHAFRGIAIPKGEHVVIMQNSLL